MRAPEGYLRSKICNEHKTRLMTVKSLNGTKPLSEISNTMFASKAHPQHFYNLRHFSCLIITQYRH